MDLITSIVYFLNIGFFSAIVARFTGANVTVLTLAGLLYVGGRPVETMGIMMTYLVFLRLTVYTQEGYRLNFKDFHYFHGWKLVIPSTLVVLGLLFYPFLALAVFIAVFISELLYSMYQKMPRNLRMPQKTLATYAIISAVILTASLAAVQFIPEDYYYGAAGAVIFLLCAFFWWVGQDRTRLASSWTAVQYACFIPAGLFGFDFSDWLVDLKRTGTSEKLAKNMPFIVLPAFFIGFVASNILFGLISFSGLILTFFAALGIRLFGYYEMSGRGKTNPVALAVTILAGVCLFLTAPQPTGITEAIDAFLPITPASDVFDQIVSHF